MVSSSAITTEPDRRFDPSVSDFMRQARFVGWPFWRGVTVGFVAAFPIAYLALA